MKSRPIAVCAAFGFVIVVMIGAIFSNWIAPYSPQEEVRIHSYHPPAKIHFRDSSGHFSIRPFVYATRAEYDENLKRIYSEDKSQKYYLRFLNSKLVTVEAPGRIYLLGTDSRGRDLFTRILFGARLSLSMAVLGALLASFLGLVMGSLSGYFGGNVDAVLMRVAEFFIMIPGLYLLLALRGALPPGLDSKQVYALIVAILALIGWGSVARVIRGLVYSIREKDFVRAAKVLGRGDAEILVRHIFPHTFSYLAIVISVSIPGFILGESALSVLGLGIQDPAVSWGNLLTESLAVAHLGMHPWITAPAILIIVTSLCFNRLGDAFSYRSQS